MKLPEAFRDWLDFDGAEFVLAKCLGLMPDIPWNPGDRTQPGAGMKAAFWSANLFGDSLSMILQQLVQLGALEQNDDRQFRWREGFDWELAADQEGFA